MARISRSMSVQLSLLSTCKLPNLSGDVNYPDSEALPRDVAVFADNSIAVIDPWCKRVSVFEKCQTHPKHYELFSNFGGVQKPYEISCPIGIEAFEDKVLVADADMVSLIIFEKPGKGIYEIKLEMPPQCIGKRSGKIYVGFNNFIQCFEMQQNNTGFSLQEISGTKFDIIPTYIDANDRGDVAVTDGNRIYLFCDFDNHADMTPSFCEWQGAQGLCFISNDELLVANNEENTITSIQLTDNTPRELNIKEKWTVLSEDDGLRNPRAVNVDHNGDVVITQWDGSIKLFAKDIIEI